jgi:hypothetical protein
MKYSTSSYITTGTSYIKNAMTQPSNKTDIFLILIKLYPPIATIEIQVSNWNAIGIYKCFFAISYSFLRYLNINQNDLILVETLIENRKETANNTNAKKGPNLVGVKGVSWHSKGLISSQYLL